MPHLAIHFPSLGAFRAAPSLLPRYSNPPGPRLCTRKKRNICRESLLPPSPRLVDVVNSRINLWTEKWDSDSSSGKRRRWREIHHSETRRCVKRNEPVRYGRVEVGITTWESWRKSSKSRRNVSSFPVSKRGIKTEVISIPITTTQVLGAIKCQSC